MVNKRNLEYEKKFRSYLFKGDAERFKDVCKSVGVQANIKLLKKKIKSKVKGCKK